MTNEKTTDSAASALSAGLERTRITEIELAALIRASSRGQVVECAYGPGWTELLPTRQNRWALEALLEMRSNAKVSGAFSASIGGGAAPSMFDADPLVTGEGWAKMPPATPEDQKVYDDLATAKIPPTASQSITAGAPKRRSGRSRAT